MNNVIKLLAQLGADATLNVSQQTRITAMMNELNIAKAQQQAILAGDVQALNSLLDICPDIVCNVNQPDGPDEDDDEEEQPKISFG
ncbi:hypothetical protein RI844_08580 [Thalassotalea fonticola]|uniref:Uncharacterized protein n=1 Tax=Thalassotalea fonticola TaxID=3065649 RepID=A0ABZ0GU94_9GAMM|nr:hypothetical protein RI844_08580 [Colwelliaceae bacterium S1-1]